MLNRPTSQWSPRNSDGQAAWDVDRNPGIRFVLLWMGMALPILIIAGRAAQLQLRLQDDFAAAFSKTTTSTEEIPVRMGRILSADGTVLAMDAQTFDIAVCYDAIQIPPDDDWVESKAKARLNKRDQRDKKKLADEKRKFVDEINKFWKDLASLTNCPTDDILESRYKVQSRIASIKDSVRRRYRGRRETETNSTLALKHSPWSDFAAWLQTNATRERSDGPERIEEENQFQPVITGVSTDVKDEINAHWMRYPYARVLVQTRRIYPQSELAAHLIGHRKPLSDEELTKRQERYPDGDPQDYRLGDPCGLSGLEREYDSTLKGVRGKRTLIKSRGEIIEIREIQQPRQGRDLTLTLDSVIQRRAEQSLDKAIKKVTPAENDDVEASRGSYLEATCPVGGAIVALDVYTGAIIAAAAAPRFDLNLLVAADQDRWNDLMEDKRRPLFSRAINMKLAPGSVFKVITAVASIESGAMPPESVCHCRGYLDGPDQPHRCYSFIHQRVGHGDVTLADALCRSCNVYFYTAARRMGPQTIVDWARVFGVGQPTGIDLPSEASGRLPDPRTQSTRWRSSDTLDLAIGQSTLEVTPLQMVRIMAAIANDGELVTPHLAANFGPHSLDDSESIHDSLKHPESQPIRGLHSQTLHQIRKGLKMVVHDVHGTAYKTVKMKEIAVAGKTGTAQTNGVDHAWFAGYAPADQPRIAFVVVLEHGGGGGKAAGPVAQEFLKSLVEFDLLKPAKTTKLATVPDSLKEHTR